MMYNKIIQIGNLTRDLEIQYLNGGSALAKGAIATTYKFKAQDGTQKEEVCFLDFTIFGKIAEIAHQYLKKGTKVMFEGRLVFEQWTGQDGQPRSKHNMRVETMKMLDGKNDLPSNTNTPISSISQQKKEVSPVMKEKIPIEIDLDEPPF